MKDREKAVQFLTIVSDTTLQAGGAVLGFITGGPVGAAAGAGAGTAAAASARAAIQQVASDFYDRRLAPLERRRAAEALTYATERFLTNLESGSEVRDPDIFAPELFAESRAHEILEGILLKARDAYEERKVPYLGNIWGNAPFRWWKPADLHMVAHFAGQLTYRQYVCLAAVQRKADFNMAAQGGLNWRNVPTLAVLLDLFHLYQFGLIAQYPSDRARVFDPLQSCYELFPGLVRLEPLGRLCHDLMGLEDIPADDIEHWLLSMYDRLSESVPMTVRKVTSLSDTRLTPTLGPTARPRPQTSSELRVHIFALSLANPVR